LSDLWNDWAEHYRSLGIDPRALTRDGPAEEQSYREARPRIVFVLKDSNDWPGHCLAEAMVPRPIRMMIMVARWAHGLLLDFPSIESADDPANQVAAIRQVAAINLKKAAGTSSCGNKVLAAFAKQGALLLNRQIADLSPEFVVACGTWKPLLNVLGCADSIRDGGMPVLRDSCTGAVVVSLRHPARARRVQTYVRLRELIEYARKAGI
jgi:hypothetical protein